MSPRETHERALLDRKRREADLAARASAIATARLLVFALAIASVAVIAWTNVPRTLWVAPLLLVLAFVGLVVVHARIHAAKDRAVAAVRFHERALARMKGEWRTFPAQGVRFAVATHPYAGDLDVFGKASLFQLLDATGTRYGEEVLAKILSGEDGGSEAKDIIARQGAVRDLAPRVELREALAVAQLSEDGEEKPDPRPFVMWAGQATSAALPSSARIVATVLPLVTLGALVATSLGRLPRIAFLVPYIASLAALNAFRPRIAPVLDAASSKEGSLSRFGTMLAVLEREAFDAPLLAQLKARLLESGASATDEMKALSRIVGFLDARNNEVFRFFVGPLFMWDLWCAIALDRWRARAGRAAFGWFRALADFEALASLGGFAFERPDHVFPELADEPVLEAEGLGHPLIEAKSRVTNDVGLPGPGHALVVTGSNMSGKSTLLRALGINVVLANAGAPVCATKLRLGALKVATSMRVSDSLEEGTSRFYAELKKLRLVLELARAAKADGPAVLFLLDEILHGTNTRERLIGARAILRELVSQHALGAVSTHDLALGDLETELAGRVRNVHFEEQVEGEVMTFDYKLRPGVVQSSNALRLMKIVGLDVVSP